MTSSREKAAAGVQRSTAPLLLEATAQTAANNTKQCWITFTSKPWIVPQAQTKDKHETPFRGGGGRLTFEVQDYLRKRNLMKKKHSGA